MSKKILFSVLLTLVVAIGVTVLYSFASSDSIRAKTPVLHQQILSVDVPESLNFADKTIDLTRYDHRERFDRELSVIVYSHAATMLNLKRANRYFPIIEPILKRNGIPSDFKYLALIESNFNVRAVSPVSAAGFWQFMPETGKEYGLEVDEEVDERLDIEKSTEAACAYLQKAYNRFGDWLLVAAAYNAGMGRIRSSCKNQQAENFGDLWLNEETSRYVFRLLAYKTFLHAPQRYGFILKKNQFYTTVPCDTLQVDTLVSDWALFAKERQIPFVLFKEYNAWIRAGKLSNAEGKTYKVVLPRKEYLKFDEKNLHLYQSNWAIE